MKLFENLNNLNIEFNCYYNEDTLEEIHPYLFDDVKFVYSSYYTDYHFDSFNYYNDSYSDICLYMRDEAGIINSEYYDEEDRCFYLKNRKMIANELNEVIYFVLFNEEMDDISELNDVEALLNGNFKGIAYLTKDEVGKGSLDHLTNETSIFNELAMRLEDIWTYVGKTPYDLYLTIEELDGNTDDIEAKRNELIEEGYSDEEIYGILKYEFGVKETYEYVGNVYYADYYEEAVEMFLTENNFDEDEELFELLTNSVIMNY